MKIIELTAVCVWKHYQKERLSIMDVENEMLRQAIDTSWPGEIALLSSFTAL